MNESIIELTNVSIGYGKQLILEDISLTIHKNDFVGIVGPNGSGKTTFLKALLGNLKIVKGGILKDNLKFGYVPQRDIVQPLLPYSVSDVVMMGRYSLIGLFNNPGKLDRKIVEESLDMVGILHLKYSSYKSLSGGQRQRTLIARALAVKPNVLILDEPTNGMDTPSHHSLLKLITQLHDAKHFTVLLVSHLLSDVANVVKRLIMIDQNKLIIGNIDEILSEDKLSKVYSSQIQVSKIGAEYFITSKHKP